MPAYSNRAPFKLNNGKVVRLWVELKWNMTRFIYKEHRTLHMYIRWAIHHYPLACYPPTEYQVIKNIYPLLDSMSEEQLVILAKECEAMVRQARKKHAWFKLCKTTESAVLILADRYRHLDNRHLACFDVLASKARNATSIDMIKHVRRRIRVFHNIMISIEHRR